jgi:hypothetical protein
MAAKVRRHARDYSAEEIAWLMSTGPSVAELLQRPEPPPLQPVVMPEWLLAPPAWVRGEGLERWTREPGGSDFPPPALQLPRRLTVTALDELRVPFRELDPTPAEPEPSVHVFTFTSDHGGCIALYQGGRDAMLDDVNCAGRFSPFGSVSIVLEGDVHAVTRTLVVVERTASELVERVIPIDEREVPSLHVEVVKPDEREPWILKTDVAAFRLDRVLSLELVDVAED